MMFSKFSIRSILFRLTLAWTFFQTTDAISQDSTNATIDSLIICLMSDEEDSNRVNVYNQLSDEFLLINYQQSIKYTSLANELAEKIDYKKGQLRAQLALGHLEVAYQLNYAAAMSAYQDALPLAKQLKDRKSEMVVYKWMGYIHGAQKSYDAAISYNHKALRIAEELQIDSDISDIHAYIGGLYEESQDTAAAIDQYAEVLAIERKNEFRETSNAAMVVIARYYFLIKDPGQSLKYYRIALKNFERLGDLRWESYTHAEMSRLYTSQKDFARAEKHAFKGLEIAEENSFKKEISDNYLVLAELYTAIDSTSKADEYKKKYDSMQMQLSTGQIMPASVEEIEEELVVEHKTKMSGFLQSVIILIPIILLVVLAGWPSRTKH